MGANEVAFRGVSVLVNNQAIRPALRRYLA